MALFSTELTDYSLPTPVVVAESEIGETHTEAEDADGGVGVADLCLTEPETPKPTIRELRAVRSLIYNRLLLEIVQRRIEKAEAVILSYLLTQENSFSQIGPYFIELGEDHFLEVTKIEDDSGWCQLYFPEWESVSEV